MFHQEHSNDSLQQYSNQNAQALAGSGFSLSINSSGLISEKNDANLKSLYPKYFDTKRLEHLLIFILWLL